jgi:hypothetical protein
VLQKVEGMSCKRSFSNLDSIYRVWNHAKLTIVPMTMHMVSMPVNDCNRAHGTGDFRVKEPSSRVFELGSRLTSNIKLATMGELEITGHRTLFPGQPSQFGDNLVADLVDMAEVKLVHARMTIRVRQKDSAVMVVEYGLTIDPELVWGSAAVNPQGTFLWDRINSQACSW